LDLENAFLQNNLNILAIFLKVGRVLTTKAQQKTMTTFVIRHNGATTFSKMTISLMLPSSMTLSITMKNLTVSITGLHTVDTVMLSVVYAEIRKKPIMLSVIMLGVFVLIIVAPLLVAK
jgi:hypothetical protein